LTFLSWKPFESQAMAKIVLAYETEGKGDADSVAVERIFADVAVQPEAGDNCGICRVVTPSGTVIVLPGGGRITVNHTILEGHRFALKKLEAGEHLLSWGLTFGIALSAIEPGSYMANERVVKALRARGMTDLPAAANFQDIIVPHILDEAAFKPAEQVPLLPEADTRTWLGYNRGPSRGVGTRNYIILLGTTTLASGFVKSLETRIAALALAAGLPSIDGIVAVAHTEGGGQRDGPRPHNYDLLLRTLGGFMVHPNIAAALVVDYGSAEETVWNEDLAAYAAANPDKVPLHDVPHAFFRATGDQEDDLAKAVTMVQSWIPAAAAAPRVPSPLSAVNIAQQCGGSDAFSGVSGNPCAGEACKLLIQHGGQAVLAETDELMGAESYILKHVKDLHTARGFMEIVEGFKSRLAWHGQSAESNPSGGNQYRGLYNIGLKSLGAAKKKHAEVRLDGVLAYGERATHMGRGYFMMDSPGNDLESIAGQVASGCNLIYFITGNGSITNFPFVPTIKIVTTTARFNLLRKDMDFNAGRYQEGTPMPELGRQLFELTCAAVDGAMTVGEKAVHAGMGAQVSLWRNWPQSGPTDVTKFNHGAREGKSVGLSAAGAAAAGGATFQGFPVAAPSSPAGSVRPYMATERIGLILPTSLCSGEVAGQITRKLNATLAAEPNSTLARRVSRFEALPHTEGCGTGYAEGGMQLYERVMLGHLTHSSVAMALCLEHGCEKTHNDFFTGSMAAAGIPTSAFGYASIQLDGGIESVTAKVLEYFRGQAESGPAASAEAETVLSGSSLARARAPLPLLNLDIGLLVTDKGASKSPEVALFTAALARAFTARGPRGESGGIVLPSTSPLLRSRVFTDALGLTVDADAEEPLEPTLAFGQRLRPLAGAGVSAADVSAAGGFHVMDMPLVKDWSEAVTGLVATGVHVIITLSTAPPKKGAAKISPGHPVVPVLHWGCGRGEEAIDPIWAAVTDSILTAPATSSNATSQEVVDAWLAQALTALAGVASGAKTAKSFRNTAFAITRGPTGVST